MLVLKTECNFYITSANVSTSEIARAPGAFWNRTLCNPKTSFAFDLQCIIDMPFPLFDVLNMKPKHMGSSDILYSI